MLVKSIRLGFTALAILTLTENSFPNVRATAESINANQSETQTFNEALRLIAVRDINRAILLLNMASSNGDTRASFLLGLLYEEGKAEQYLKLASDNLNPDASFVLAEIYSRRASPNEEIIKRLLLRAQDAGKPQAKLALLWINTGMLPSQAVNFRRRTDYDWTANFFDLLIPVQLPDGTTPSQQLLLQGYVVANSECNGCHLGGIAGAPKLSDRSQWEKRKIDIEQMSKRVYYGYKACPPAKNNHKLLSFDQIKAAIYFMLWTAYK